MSFRDGNNGAWRLAVRILLNAASLFPLAYGLYCVVSMSGWCVAPQGPDRSFTRWFALVPVEGTAAVLAGLGYVALGIFVQLSSGTPPIENRAVYWRMARGAARWGSLLAMLWFWYKARHV